MEQAPKEQPQQKNKRLVFCFDGTWNQLSADCLTNVALVAQMVRPMATDGTPQLIYYNEGIGTGRKWLGKALDGAFGRGMVRIMRDAYRFLIFNYEPGDEIFAFGFSRGAYTARTFIGLVRHAGIIDIARASQIDQAIDIYRHAPAGTGLESAEGLHFRAENATKTCVSAADRDYRLKTVPGFAWGPEDQFLQFKYLGVWDTVRALGVPGFIKFATLLNRKYAFHNALLTSKIQSARHAVAIDEPRKAFRPTLFGREKVAELNARNMRAGKPPIPAWKLHYQEKWFPGVHSAVGGGGVRRGLSDGPLGWILAGARDAGLQLRDDGSDVMFAIKPDAYDLAVIDPRKNGPPSGPIGLFARWLQGPRDGPETLDEVALPTLRRWQAEPLRLREERQYRPATLSKVAQLIDQANLAIAMEFKSAHPVFDWYVLRRGDTLGKLALSRLGASKRWREIFELNRDLIDNPDQVPIGLTIRLPVA